MKLTELEPQFVRHYEDEGHRYLRDVYSIGEANGVKLKCPKCAVAKSMHLATVHSVTLWSPEVGAQVAPGLPRWRMTGTGYADLTLEAGLAVSTIMMACGARFFLNNGEVHQCS